MFNKQLTNNMKIHESILNSIEPINSHRMNVFFDFCLTLVSVAKPMRHLMS